MKATNLLLLMLALALPSFAQTPAGPVTPASQVQSAASAEPASPATASAPAAQVPSSVAAANAKIVVPADTTIPMILMNAINTKSAFVGQAIYCESIYPITVGKQIVIPKGSSIRGTVTQVVRPGRGKGRAQLSMRFDELILPNGTTRHLRATLSGFGSTGDDKYKPSEGQIQGAGSKAQDARRIGETTLIGGGVGSIVGGGTGARLEGAGIGAAAGAATGVVWVLATRGKEIVLPHGTSLELQLSQPVSFDREEVEPPSHYEEGPTIPRHEYGPRN